MPFVGALLIDAVGWRGGLLAQGAMTVVFLVPLALLLRPPPDVQGRGSLSQETPSGLPNWLLTIWVAAAALGCCTCMAVPLMHLVPLVQGKGVSAPEASGVLLTMMIVAIAGRVAFGKLADMIGAIPAYAIASAWQTILVLGFTYMQTLGQFYAWAVIYGFGYAGVMTAIFATMRSVTAPAFRASSLGVVLAAAYVGHGLGGWQGGLLYDLTGAYDWSYRNAALAGAGNLVLLSLLWLTLNRFRPAAPSSA